MKECREIICKIHGRSSDGIAIFHNETDEVFGMYCGRCLADFFTRWVGQAEPVLEDTK